MKKISTKTLEILHPRSLKHLSEYLQSSVRSRLWLKVLLSMVGGVGLGIALGPDADLVKPSIASMLADWLALPGQVFLGLVQMIVVPLVFASIIRGVAASENMEYLRKTGSQALIFFVGTTTVAICLGIGLTYLLQPGNLISPDLLSALAAYATAPVAATTEGVAISMQSIPDALVGLLPRNPLSSMVNLEMLQVVLFAAIIGVALLALSPDQSVPILDLLGSIQQVCMIIVKWAMHLAPIAVFGLMARISSKIGFDALVGMAAYVGTVILGLILVNIMFLVIYAVVIRQSPLQFLRATREVQLLAFSTSSSAAVMPLSIKTAEEKLGVRASISQFVIPLGATVNMNGTALYQGVATIFLAQVFGIDLNIGAITLLVITAVASSIGSPATPGVGIVILSMVLTTVGVPPAGIGLIMGVDRILDMSRTAVNVAGDLVASVVLNKWIGGTPADQQSSREAEQERLRLQTGADVVVE